MGCVFYGSSKLIQLSFRSYLKNLTMPFYAVAKGKMTGIFTTWSECQDAVHNYKNPKFRKFNTRQEAEDFVNMYDGKFIPNNTVDQVQAEPVLDLPEPQSNCIESVQSMAEQLFRKHMEEVRMITASYEARLLEELNRFKSSFSSIRNNFQQSGQDTTTSVTSKKRNLSERTDEGCSKKVKNEKDDDDETDNYGFDKDKNGFVIVFTDGACENNGRPNAKAGIGVWFGHNHPLNVGEPVEGRPTNNVAEIQACTRAIHIACQAGVTKLCINTDSQFVINSMTSWLPNWKANNWNLKGGGIVKNKEEFIELDAASKLLEIRWNYVKGHAGIDGNEGADQLAREGARNYRI